MTVHKYQFVLIGGKNVLVLQVGLTKGNLQDSSERTNRKVGYCHYLKRRKNQIGTPLWTTKPIKWGNLYTKHKTTTNKPRRHRIRTSNNIGIFNV